MNQRLLGRGGRFPRRVGDALAAGLRSTLRAGAGVRRAAIRAGAGAALVAGLLAQPAQAQLRPLDPLDWRSVGFEGARVSVGAGLLSGQRASLAGTEGRLLEVGSLRAVWGLGRVSVEMGGTALWVFEDRTIHAPPAQDVFPPDGARRRDVGEVHVATVVRLGRWSGGREAALRFGARLPTGDNQQGMERDRTDLFALLAGRTGGARWEVGGEVGLGVHGTRDDWNEQVDPVLFGASGRFEVARAVAMVLELTGQYDPRNGPPQRGNENLAETRLGIRLGSERWIQASLVRGWARHSPTLGALVRVGKAFGT